MSETNTIPLDAYQDMSRAYFETAKQRDVIRAQRDALLEAAEAMIANTTASAGQLPFIGRMAATNNLRDAIRAAKG
jgi:hypothetical protein